MSPTHVKMLGEKLEEHGGSHGLTDLKFWSFSFSHGFKVKLAASDVVHGVTALLEGLRPPPARMRTRRVTTAKAAAAEEPPFWRAVNALGMTRSDEMSAGLGHAMRAQRALMAGRTGPSEQGGDSHCGRVAILFGLSRPRVPGGSPVL